MNKLIPALSTTRQGQYYVIAPDGTVQFTRNPKATIEAANRDREPSLRGR